MQTKDDMHNIALDVYSEFNKLAEEYKINSGDIPDTADIQRDDISIRKTSYNVSSLIELYNNLERIIDKSDNDLTDVFKDLSEILASFFQSKYVEFLLLKDNYIEYSYITIPEWLLKLTRKVSGITAIIGMKIPLFEGSIYTELIKNAVPRELITYKDRLKSFRDFVEPNTKENIIKRDFVAPLLMNFFGYNYIFQIPLKINNKVFGYFSFLQKGRFSNRVKADIIMLSGKIENLISLKKIDQDRKAFCRIINQPVIILSTVYKDDLKGYDFLVEEVNEEFEKIFSIAKKDIINKSIFSIVPDQYDKLYHIFHIVYATGKSDMVDIHLTGNNKIFRSAISKTENDSILIIGEDATEKQKLAHFDKLTEVYNRHTFLEKCSTAIKTANKNDALIALFFIDVDQLKPVNDKYGHEAGDWYLNQIACSLKFSLRKKDIVGRYGGDEFTVLSVVNDRSDAERIVEKISDTINSISIAIPDGALITGSASIGIAYSDKNKREDIDELIRQSDKAMYVAKKNSKKYCFYDSINK